MCSIKVTWKGLEMAPVVLSIPDKGARRQLSVYHDLWVITKVWITVVQRPGSRFRAGVLGRDFVQTIHGVQGRGGIRSLWFRMGVASRRQFKT
jgi:hypothetical protein